MKNIASRIKKHDFKESISLVIWFFIAFIICSLPVDTSAQVVHKNQPNELNLTLKKALQMAQKNNTQNRIADANTKIVRSQYRQTDALFLPQLSVEENAISTNNPLNVFGALLKQEVVTAADFNPATLNHPDRRRNFATSINLRESLINPSGIMKRQAVKKQFKASQMQKVRTNQYVDLRVKQTWYHFMLLRRKTGIIDTTLTAAKANLKQARSFYKQGMMNKADVLAAVVRSKQLQSKLSKARNDLYNVQQQLTYLIGVPEETKISPKGTLKMTSVPVPQTNLGPMIKNRPDMMAMKYQIEASRKKLSSSEFNFLPSVNFFGTYGWNDKAFLGTRANSYTVGITLKWNLFKGFKNIGSVQQSQAQLSKAKLQYQDHLRRNKVEVQSERRSLREAREQVEIARTTVKQARETYRIRHNRYKQGMQNMSDLLNAQATFSQSKLKLAAALFQYNVHAAKLKYLLDNAHNVK